MKVTVREIKYSFQGIEVQDTKYENVKRIIFDYEYNTDYGEERPVFRLVYEEVTATFWQEYTQIELEN